MNPIAYLPAQLRKDFTSVRWLIILWLVMMTGMVVDGCTVGTLSHALAGRRYVAQGTIFAVLPWGFGLAYDAGMWLLPLLFISNLFLEEPVFGRNRNWMLRPPGVGGALAAKVLLLILLLVVLFVIESLGLMLAGSPPLFALGVAARALVQTGLVWAALVSVVLLASDYVQYSVMLAGLLGFGLWSETLLSGGESPVKAVIGGLSAGAMLTAAVLWRRRWVLAVVFLAWLDVAIDPAVRALSPAFGLQSYPDHPWLLTCDRMVQAAAARWFGVPPTEVGGKAGPVAVPTAFSGAFVQSEGPGNGRFPAPPSTVLLPRWPQGWILVSNLSMWDTVLQSRHPWSHYGSGHLENSEVRRMGDLMGDFSTSSLPVLFPHISEIEGSDSALALEVPQRVIDQGRERRDGYLDVSAYAPVVLAELPLATSGEVGTSTFRLRTWREGDRVLARLLRRMPVFTRAAALPRPFLRCVRGDESYNVVSEDHKTMDEAASPSGEWSLQDVHLTLRAQQEAVDWNRIRLQLIVYEFRESRRLEVK